MPEVPSILEHSAGERRPGGLAGLWHSSPLYLRILGALVLAVPVGLALGERAAILAVPSRLILRLLSALAPPLILAAVIRALMRAEIRGRMAARLVGLLVLNTVVAIVIGLAVANALKPGRHAKLPPPEHAAHAAAQGPLMQFLENVPKSVLGPLVEGNVLGVIFLAVAFGVALRRLRECEVRTVGDIVDLAYDSLLIVLHWVIDLVPLGVFGIVAGIIGEHGFGPFRALGFFIAAVLLALGLQAIYYLVRVKLWSWVSPWALIVGCRDALVMAFSTASSTATMPVTFSCLRDRVRLREESASMGALVGANFNNDGTALYEAMAALFVAQMLGMGLSLEQQFLVVVTSIVASVGAAGIPEAGLVTMTLVFGAVGLPVQNIALLLTVDWFLDRSRTAINVMGDMNVSCILDGRYPESEVSARSAG